ncbi:MAG: hypothetical protein K9N21_17680 [Deltaproteobacteria bacterium]|nr:hypothetical protein [Deltaproteobacteria bacterium]
MSRWQIILIAGLVVLITGLHFMTPVNMPSLHIVYRELYFVPIILAGLWGGKKGGLCTSIAISLIYIPHIFSLMKPHPSLDPNMMLNVLATSAESLWGNLFQLIFYNLVGFFLGYMIQNMEKAHQASIRSERLAAVGKTVAEIAHDMKAPLMAIGGFSAQLAKAIDKDDQASRKKLNIVMKETARLEAMIKDMLDFARPLELSVSPADLNQVVSETVGVAQSIAQEAGVGLLMALDQSIPSLMLDVTRVRQVIMNLVTNAVQASPKGEEVTIRTRGSGGAVALDVIDRGRGIAVEDRENIFQPFFSTKKDGTGLGLANVKKIVEAHGGKVSFRPNAEKGVTFTAEFAA